MGAGRSARPQSWQGRDSNAIPPGMGLFPSTSYLLLTLCVSLLVNDVNLKLRGSPRFRPEIPCAVCMSPPRRWGWGPKPCRVCWEPGWLLRMGTAHSLQVWVLCLSGSAEVLTGAAQPACLLSLPGKQRSGLLRGWRLVTGVWKNRLILYSIIIYLLTLKLYKFLKTDTSHQ